jgi:hypothetical protein
MKRGRGRGGAGRRAAGRGGIEDPGRRVMRWHSIVNPSEIECVPQWPMGRIRLWTSHREGPEQIVARRHCTVDRTAHRTFGAASRLVAGLERRRDAHAFLAADGDEAVVASRAAWGIVIPPTLLAR